jgi:hypothetical protein
LRTPWQLMSINYTLHISLRLPLGVRLPRSRLYVGGKFRISIATKIYKNFKDVI